MATPVASAARDPFALLCELDARIRAVRAEDLDAPSGPAWRGLAVRLRTTWFVIPQAEVREILSLPPMARVPGARAFLMGVANLRGSLLPVTDLGLLADMPAVPEHRDRRVLVLNSERIPAGFAVDAVGGYRSFAPHDQRHAWARQAAVPGEWLLGAFVRGAQAWPVLSLQRVARSATFGRAGVAGTATGAPA